MEQQLPLEKDVKQHRKREIRTKENQETRRELQHLSPGSKATSSPWEWPHWLWTPPAFLHLLVSCTTGFRYLLVSSSYWFPVLFIFLYSLVSCITDFLYLLVSSTTGLLQLWFPVLLVSFIYWFAEVTGFIYWFAALTGLL